MRKIKELVYRNISQIINLLYTFKHIRKLQCHNLTFLWQKGSQWFLFLFLKRQKIGLQ